MTMSNSIEKAAERLEQLRQAGAQMPAAPRQVASPQPVAESPPVVAAAVEAILSQSEAASPGSPAQSRPATPTPTPLPLGSKTVQLDFARLTAAGFVTPNAPRSKVADQFRVIKRPLIDNATGKGASIVQNGNLIMVSSALPSEGKTFCAINLAISMAMELDYTVLLVDADVSRPSVLNQLGLPPERGLMDALAGDVTDLSDVLLRTNIEKLTLLPAGMPHARATELLASEAMTQLLEQMSNRYPDRIIIFDSPPLLVTTESRVLATHMGQIVMVVEAERTTHATVRQALATIENCPVKLMVLNKSRERGPGSYYGYGYGYGEDVRTEAA